jgi:hypothetical protein
MLTPNTIKTIDKLLATIEDIKAGKFPQYKLNEFLRKLSIIDYRNEYEKKVDYYIKIFAQGAVIEVPIDPKKWTAINSPKTEKKTDVIFHCKNFIKESFKYVQQPFWKRYKNEMDKWKTHYIWQPDPIPPYFILKTCKNLKTRKKK